MQTEEIVNGVAHPVTRPGLKAFIPARRLRRLAGFPESRLNASPPTAQQVLRNAWRPERTRRSAQARLPARSLAAIQAVKAAKDKTEVPHKGDIP
ncbi:hypothetical protein [Pantoea ananatis]|uniref:hypothetical protein n=1 Tax=Pantoea ananas TaxID=553 RepID=UPI001EE58601|nr:hypothetical protein [Pantoea ananatis]PKC45626.1 hypothetical protein V461_06030 [Pantoea ananatis BRT98]